MTPPAPKTVTTGALQIARNLGERHLEAQTLIETARTEVQLGRSDRAAAQVRDAMTIIEEIGGGLLERQARAVLDSLRPHGPV